MYRSGRHNSWQAPDPAMVDAAQPLDFDHPHNTGLAAVWPMWLQTTPLLAFDRGPRGTFDLSPTGGSTISVVSDPEFGGGVRFGGTQLNYFLSTGGAAVSAVPLTMAVWFKTPSITKEMMLASMADGGGVSGRVQMTAAGTYSGDPISVATVGSGNSPVGVVNSSTGYTANRWHHAAAVFYSDSLRAAFCDGGGKATETTTVPLGPLVYNWIGHHSAFGVSYLDATLADVRFYSRALSDAEIYDLYAHPFAGYRVRTTRRYFVPSAVTTSVPWHLFGRVA